MISLKSDMPVFPADLEFLSDVQFMTHPFLKLKSGPSILGLNLVVMPTRNRRLYMSSRGNSSYYRGVKNSCLSKVVITTPQQEQSMKSLRSLNKPPC